MSRFDAFNALERALLVQGLLCLKWSKGTVMGRLDEDVLDGLVGEIDGEVGAGVGGGV